MTAASSSNGGGGSAPPAWEQRSQVCRGSGHARVSPPCGLVSAFTSLEQRAKLDSAKRFVMELNVRWVITKQSCIQQLQLLHQQQASAAASAIKQMRPPPVPLLCRIYVGSIGYDTNDAAIRAAFEPFGAVKAVEMGWDATGTKHKGFAFVEYEIPDAAALAIAGMNGAILGTRNVRVSRPNNVTDPGQMIDELIKEGELQAWIYVANVRPDLSEGDLRLVFEAFGAVLQCALAPPVPAGGATQPAASSLHRGFGYIQYETTQAAVEATRNMNKFDLGGQQLRVGRAITPPHKLLPRLKKPSQPPPPPPCDVTSGQTEAEAKSPCITADADSCATAEAGNGAGCTTAEAGNGAGCTTAEAGNGVGCTTAEAGNGAGCTTAEAGNGAGCGDNGT